MNSLKLDYLLNNNRKLHLQKKFLEKTIEKDLRNLQTEMQKSEIDMQRDAFITSQQAQQKLGQMYTVVRDSLSYIREVVQFMNFDVGEKINGKVQEYEPELKVPQKRASQMSLTDQQPRQASIDDSPAQIQTTEDKNLEYFFRRNIHELAEVVLSVLCELY